MPMILPGVGLREWLLEVGLRRLRVASVAVLAAVRMSLLARGGVCWAVRWMALAGELGEDLDAGAGADAGGSGVEHGGGVGERADAAGGLDAGAGAGYAAKQGDVVGGGAAGGEAGGGFEEVGAGGEGEVGGAEFFFEGEQAGFEDDLDDGSGAVGELDDAADVLARRRRSRWAGRT